MFGIQNKYGIFVFVLPFLCNTNRKAAISMYKIRLYEMRTKKNLTLRELSSRCGISISSLNQIENGLQSPTLDTLARIATALECKISDLYVEY